MLIMSVATFAVGLAIGLRHDNNLVVLPDVPKEKVCAYGPFISRALFLPAGPPPKVQVILIDTTSGSHPVGETICHPDMSVEELRMDPKSFPNLDTGVGCYREGILLWYKPNKITYVTVAVYGLNRGPLEYPIHTQGLPNTDVDPNCLIIDRSSLCFRKTGQHCPDNTSCMASSLSPMSCQCDLGYTSPNNTDTCVDVDECHAGSHECDLNTHTCHNLDGSYECAPKSCDPASATLVSDPSGIPWCRCNDREWTLGDMRNKTYCVPHRHARAASKAHRVNQPLIVNGMLPFVLIFFLNN